MNKTRYRFSHRAGGTYYWIATTTLRGDSRSSEISCSVTWFWGQQ